MLHNEYKNENVIPLEIRVSNSLFLIQTTLDENSSHPKLFWSLVKKLMGNVGRSCTMPPLLDTENYILCVDDIDKYNLLNGFFSSISNVDDNNCNPPNLELRTNSKLAIIEFTINEISDILKSLNIKRKEKKPPGTI